MQPTVVSRTIEAPIERVFDTIAHIENFSRAVPAITEVEFLSDVRRGIGTRFRETRLMGKREASTELEITEYVENERVRIVSDAGGTLWDTVFTTRQIGDQVELTLAMDAKAHKLMARLLNPLIRGMIRKAIEGDMDAVKTFCEAPE